YPNPAIERFQLQSDGWSSDVVYAEIYNNLGIMVQNRQIAVNNQAINAEIDLSGNAPGVYTLRLRDAQNRQTSQKISLVK
ncbi:MAG: T9SS type A sorting domain-containing protein, partial [Bacteroidetes bacterium]|nr:T9SS type A sorting domain-containing protein [Bacteroidota bacterium]